MDARPPSIGRRATGRPRGLAAAWALFAVLLVTLGFGGAGLALHPAPAEAARLDPAAPYAQHAPGEGPAVRAPVAVSGDQGLASAALAVRAGFVALETPAPNRAAFEHPPADRRRPSLAHAYQATGPPRPPVTARA